MPRLRTVSPKMPGWTRRRAGKGFAYFDQHGQRLDDEARTRAESLVIPPAWQEVWICPLPNGHIQAVGTDDAGRRQYRYHEQWRLKRDKSKHDRILQVAAKLPEARRRVAEDLQRDGMPYERALATAFRLLDLGFFRIGGEAYAEENNSYGLATIQKQHVSIEGDDVVFDYVAKSGKERYIALGDPLVRQAVADLLHHRSGSPDLLAYHDGQDWHDVTSSDINAYVKEVVGGEVSAKDFRTWHGTVIAAVALSRAGEPKSESARKRAVSAVYKQVSAYLGNTPTVARQSYVDPRVVDLYNDGIVVNPELVAGEVDLFGGATHGEVEQAVLEMLTTPKRQLKAAARSDEDELVVTLDGLEPEPLPTPTPASA